MIIKSKRDRISLRQGKALVKSTGLFYTNKKGMRRMRRNVIAGGDVLWIR